MKKLIIFLMVGSVSFSALIVEPEYVHIGGTFTVLGSEFEPDEDVLVSAIGKTSKVKSTSDGKFSCVFSVDLTPGGEISITAQSLSKIENTKIWVLPKVKLFPTSGISGDKITVEGMGYGEGERIQIGLGRAYLVAEAYASSLGTFSATFTVGAHPKGENRLFAIGHSTYLLAEESFIMKPRLTITPNEGFVDSNVSIRGDGFAQGEEVRIDFGKTQTIGTTTTDRDGSFCINIRCPKGSEEQIVMAKTRDEELTAVFTIKPRLLSVEPRRGYVGSKITISLDGLKKNETVTVSFDSEYATFTASLDGVLEDGFVVSKIPGGMKTITVKAGLSNIFHTQLFEIRPSIFLVTPPEVYFGTKIIFEGCGFLPGEKIRVDFGMREGILLAVANEKGCFVSEYVIEDQPGNYRLVAIGLTTHNAAIRYINVLEPKKEEEKK